MLVNKKTEAKNTVSYFFEKPEDFQFEAGQYVYITLSKLNYPDERGDTRHFTIASSPKENYIQLTTRLRGQSGYKKTLDELPIGSEVEARGPQGLLKLSKHSKLITNYIFLAGGIGITPFRSIIKDVLENNLGLNIHLIYSNSDSDFIFKEELTKWHEENKNLKIDFIDTSISGHVNTQMLQKLIPTYDIETTMFYAVGPNPFVNAMEEMLEGMKIPEDSIKTEKFTGY